MGAPVKAANKTQWDKPTLVHLSKPHTEAIDFIKPPVLVKVGTPPTTFHVEENLLCSGSEFFKLALKKELREGQRRVVELPEEQAAVFNVYLNWLYRRYVYVDCESPSERGEYEAFGRLTSAYFLGDMLMDGDFKDAITDAMAVQMLSKDEEGTMFVPHPVQIQEVYEKTAAGAKARSLLVHRIVRLGQPELVNSDCVEFLQNLAQRQMIGGMGDDMSAVVRCVYHEHEAGSEHCYRNKYARALEFKQ